MRLTERRRMLLLAFALAGTLVVVGYGVATVPRANPFVPSINATQWKVCDDFNVTTPTVGMAHVISSCP
jgi:hypothetical protein